MTPPDRPRGRRGAAGGTGVTVQSGGEVSQLLPMAVRHHEEGNLARARALYEQIIAIEPEHADALQFLGILCQQDGDPQRAEALIRRAIAAKPGVAPYHDNLGAVLEAAGRLDEALAAWAAAEALEPGDPDRGFNAGLVLSRMGRAEDAEAHLRRALEARPDDAECRFALANVLRQRGAREQAETVYRALLRGRPEHVGAWVNLGNLLQDEDRIEEAVAAYRRALAQAPQDAHASHNLGRALRREGRLGEARAAFEQALRQAPELVDARVGLAQVLEESGELDRALDAFRAACEGPSPPDAARAGLVRVARIHPPRRSDAVLARELVAAVREQRVPAAALARALGVQLAARAGLYAAPPGDDAAALSLALAQVGDPLFTALLEGAPNVVPEVERWLAAARRGVLESDAGGDDTRHTALLCALALQGAHADYPLPLSSREAAAHEARRAALEDWLAQRGPAPEPVARELLAFACCAPLASLDGADRLAAQLAAAPWNGGDLDPVIQRSLLEPLAERQLAEGVQTLEAIEDAVSHRVRAQYEEHPYPRWTELPRRRAGTPGAGVAHALDARPGDASAPRDVLVAGCGTGQEALAWATRFPAHRVLGLDLSRSSLAYARRMAERLGIESVEFLHGDLLHVGRLDRRFDVVTAGGVLHHLEDPVAGWRALLGVLAPDGLMRVGLYSRAARAPVNAARARIQALGLPASAQGVRALRQRVLRGEEPALTPLLDSEDFYTTASCRDLLFHPMEHQFDLGEVAGMLAALGLRFLGFDLPHPLVQGLFLASGGAALDDLGAWQRFETAHPQTFEGMYQFWCERREDAAEVSTYA